MRYIVVSALALSLLLMARGTRADEAPPRSPIDRNAISDAIFTVKTVDANGRPLRNVGISMCGMIDGAKNGIAVNAERRTDANGEYRGSFRDQTLGYAVYARHEDLQLLGYRKFSTDLLVNAMRDKSPIKITLVPECRVYGEMSCAAMDALSEVSWARNVIATAKQGEFTAFFYRDHDSVSFEFRLPPGRYTLNLSRSHYAKMEGLPFTVPADTGEIYLGRFDLPLVGPGTLVGKPAPELKDVVAWVSCKPLQWADLKGKYVLMCIFSPKVLWSVPEINNLQTRYPNLFILGVCCDTGRNSLDVPIQTVEEFERARLKSGFTITYPVAILKAQAPQVVNLRYEYGTVRTIDDYFYNFSSDRSRWLIDPNGNVVGVFDPKEHPQRLKNFRVAVTSSSAVAD